MSDIFSLATQNKAEELRSMFSKGIGAKAADSDGKTLLHHAAAVNAVAVIDLLVERGAPLDAKDVHGLTPAMHAAKKKCEDGVISLIERGADPNPKLPDGSWLSDWFSQDAFPPRVLAARQVYAARSAAKSSNLLLSILNASSSSNGSAPTSPNGPLHSSGSTGSIHSPLSPGGLESPASGPAPMLSKTPAKTSTIRRSTISLKATADKEIVMSLDSPKDTPRASRIITTPAPMMSQVPHSRRASVAYATIRPRSTLSSSEGTALREEVAAQMSQRGFSSSSPAVIPSKSIQSNTTTTTHNAETASPSAAPIIDPSAGSAVSTAFAAADSKKDKKGDSKKTKDKKDKLDKKEKKEKKTKKSDTSSDPKKESKKEFRRKQAEDEAAKAEARAEKTRKRKTLSFFGSKSKDSSSSSKSSSKSASTAAPSSSPSAATSSSPSSNHSAASPSETKNSSESLVASSAPSSSTATMPSAVPAETSSAPGVTSPETVEAGISLVDTIPEGAVALPNGDFLIGVEADAVNLDALTDAMAKVAREVTSPLLGTANFEIKALLEATKVLSTTLKSILSVSEVYALTLETPEAGAEFTKITEALRTETARSLVLAIKAVTVNSSDVEPLKRALVELSVNVARLYKCLEFASPASVVENLQGVVAILRTVVSASRNETSEVFRHESAQAVIITMRLCSLVQDFAFASCKSVRNQRSLTDSAFALAQSLRGLLVAAQGVQTDPKNDQHAQSLAQMLKTAAEYVRAISRTLREEEAFTTNPKLAHDNDHLLEPAPQDVVLAYLRKGCGLMANAKDKYVAKCTVGLANDEKQILNLIVTQAQLVATLMEAIGALDMTRITQTAVSTGLSMSTLQRLLQPLLDTCLDQDLVEETVVCLENVIRCGIQVKILCTLIASHPTSSEYRLQLAQMCQLWGIYSTLLLEAVYRSLHDL